MYPLPKMAVAFKHEMSGEDIPFNSIKMIGPAFGGPLPKIGIHSSGLLKISDQSAYRVQQAYGVRFYKGLPRRHHRCISANGEPGRR